MPVGSRIGALNIGPIRLRYPVSTMFAFIPHTVPFRPDVHYGGVILSTIRGISIEITMYQGGKSPSPEIVIFCYAALMRLLLGKVVRCASSLQATPSRGMSAEGDSSLQPDKKKKKPLACDQCKSRRVLCHPQPLNTSCPRCTEKGIKLKPQHSSPDVPAKLNLTPELVGHLFECFAQLPQNRHPAFCGASLKHDLAGLSWKINSLPAQWRVLAYCVIALSTTVSFHCAIIGPGPQPPSLTDHAIFFHGNDLRSYDLRRAPVCRKLHTCAQRLARKFGVMLEVSEDNIASVRETGSTRVTSSKRNTCMSEQLVLHECNTPRMNIFEFKNPYIISKPRFHQDVRNLNDSFTKFKTANLNCTPSLAT
ncbi:hypothetical protein DFH07DRAFT_783962 [Mycena maculata]|uniref:Zn(2)-C6 fungal-type domain-containing protein n=1 Tax=Mycena maculata TaxID=230809 RepID=A0AAD7HJE6_9AGAR|nr:hypothetical protein DFH07DRAFT_783962 [Mycena maculata]